MLPTHFARLNAVYGTILTGSWTDEEMCCTAIDTRDSEFESLAVIDYGAWEAVRNIARNNTTDVWWPVCLTVQVRRAGGM